MYFQAVILSLLFALAKGTPLSDTDASWPLPHNITGYASAEKWGGVHIHDPALIAGPDGYYYSFGTHGRVTISRAKTLDGYWDFVGSALGETSVIDLPGRNDTWAPDISLVNGTYYLYYSVSTFGSQDSAIGLATSKTLLPGSWTDHGAVLRSGKDQPFPLNQTNAIDPNLFIDPKTGDALLSYGSFWTDIWQYKLNKDLKSVDKSRPAVQLSYEPKGTNPEEGAFLDYQNGWYYLWISHGVCCGFNATKPAAGEEYSIRVGRSKSPQGPFVDKAGVDLKAGGGTTVYGSHGYVYGPGGQGVLKNYNGRDVLYFHYAPTYVSYVDEDKLIGWLYIDYHNGWPKLVY